MRLLDIEFKRAIQDIPTKAFEELRTELRNVRFNQHFADLFSLDTDSLRKVIDTIRQRYGLEPTTYIDDDKAIQDIEDPIEQRIVMQRRGKTSDVKVPVRRISEAAMDDILNKEINVRKVAQYADTLRGMSAEQIKQVKESVYAEYNIFDLSAEDRRYVIDSKYGIDYFGKIFALNNANASLVLKECFSKGTREDFKKMKAAIENMSREGNCYRGLYGEISEVASILGLGSHDDALSSITMADVAEAIENRELELGKTQGFSMRTIISNAFNDRTTRDAKGQIRAAERNFRTNRDGVAKDE